MKRALLLLLVISLSAPVVAAGPQKPEKILRVAIYDLQVEGPEPRTASIFIDSVAIELRKLRAVDVVTMDEIRAMIDLEAQKALIGCEQDSCLAEIADALGADVIITGSVADVGEERVLGLQRVSQGEAKVGERYQLRIKRTDGSGLLAAVGPAIEALFPERPLRAGQVRGVDKAIALRLNPPPIPPWAFWTTGGIGAGALVVGASLMASAAIPYGAAATAADSPATKNAGDIRTPYETANALFISGEVVGLLGLALVGSAGAMVLFTDFDNVAEEVRQ